jgi:hypothetical protein
MRVLVQQKLRKVYKYKHAGLFGRFVPSDSLRGGFCGSCDGESFYAGLNLGLLLYFRSVQSDENQELLWQLLIS